MLVEAIKKPTSSRATSSRKQGDRERRRGHHGHGRVNERRAALPGHRTCGRAWNGPSTTSSACARQTPVLCDLKPSGKYLAVDLHRAGGMPAGHEGAAEAPACCTAIASPSPARPSPRTWLKDIPDEPARRPGRDPRRSPNPMYAEGPPRDPQGQPLTRKAAVAKITGLKNAGDHGTRARLRR